MKNRHVPSNGPNALATQQQENIKAKTNADITITAIRRTIRFICC
jgi:hypothetical protein